MTHAWTPEHPVDEALARELVHGRFPDLAALHPRRLGQGWDCDVWAFGEVAFRFPRRTPGVALIEVELRVLPTLAPRLSLAAPTPSHVGAPTAAFPFPFYGHPIVPGTPADEAEQDDAARAALAPRLGRFLRELHAVDPRAVGAPEDDFKWDLVRKATAARGRLPLLTGSPVAPYLPLAEQVLTHVPAHSHGRALLHGDLYVRHVMLDGGDVSGVIDWGDVRWGDPAIDLAVAYSFLPPEARPAFWEAYGEVDLATRKRARLTGLANHGVSLLAYAYDVGDARLAAEAERSLRYAVS